MLDRGNDCLHHATTTISTTTAWYLRSTRKSRPSLGARIENHSQEQHQPVQDLFSPFFLIKKKKERAGRQNVCMHERRTDHDEGIRDGSKGVEMALEYERKDGEHAAEKIDGHERKRDADNRAVPVDLEILRSRDALSGGQGQTR